MAISHSFNIISLKTDTDANGRENSVYKVQIEFVAENEEGVKKVRYQNMRFSSDEVSDDDFVAFENLTKEMVEGWINNNLSDMVRQDIESELEGRFASNKKSQSLPWEPAPVDLTP